jgi:predicted nucleic acid-binding protein
MNGNETNFLIDTNIIIYLSQRKLKVNDFAKKESNLYLSSITYIESLGYSFSSKEEEKEISELCEIFERLFLTEKVEEQTIQIRKTKKIKLPDAIIAATAIVYDLTLVTCNTDDFKNISGLKILDPLG